MVTCIGYDNAERDWQKGQGPLDIRLYERTTTIDEVVVTGSTFQFGQANGVKQLGALDVVLDGGSCGDIVSALQSLPGTQKVGEDGKLYVRGGSSEECQTYINGMHVLQPYSTTAPNSPSRGRFSHHLFPRRLRRGIWASTVIGAAHGDYRRTGLGQIRSERLADRLEHWRNKDNRTRLLVDECHLHGLGVVQPPVPRPLELAQALPTTLIRNTMEDAAHSVERMEELSRL